MSESNPPALVGLSEGLGPNAQDVERQTFEAAMAANGYHLDPQRYRDGTYRDTGYAAGWAMWQAAMAAQRERMIADGWRQTRYVAPVTDCEACLTPDACAIRGQCGHYLRERA